MSERTYWSHAGRVAEEPEHTDQCSPGCFAAFEQVHVLTDADLAARDAEVRREVAERIVTPEAREHWDWAEGRRARFGDDGCVCALCGVMSRIARQGGSDDER